MCFLAKKSVISFCFLLLFFGAWFWPKFSFGEATTAPLSPDFNSYKIITSSTSSGSGTSSSSEYGTSSFCSLCSRIFSSASAILKLPHQFSQIDNRPTLFRVFFSAFKDQCFLLKSNCNSFFIRHYYFSFLIIEK